MEYTPEQIAQMTATYYAQQAAQQAPPPVAQPPQAFMPPPVAQTVYNSRGFLKMREDYSIGGIVGLDVNWLQGLINRYMAGDMSVVDTDQQGAPTGKLKLSVSAKYKVGSDGSPRYAPTFYVPSDLPPRA